MIREKKITSFILGCVWHVLAGTCFLVLIARPLLLPVTRGDSQPLFPFLYLLSIAAFGGSLAYSARRAARPSILVHVFLYPFLSQFFSVLIALFAATWLATIQSGLKNSEVGIVWSLIVGPIAGIFFGLAGACMSLSGLPFFWAAALANVHFSPEGKSAKPS